MWPELSSRSDRLFSPDSALSHSSSGLLPASSARHTLAHSSSSQLTNQRYRAKSVSPRLAGSNHSGLEKLSVLELLDVIRESYERETANAFDVVAKLHNEVARLQGLLTAVGLGGQAARPASSRRGSGQAVHSASSRRGSGREENPAASRRGSGNMNPMSTRRSLEPDTDVEKKDDVIFFIDVVKPQQLEGEPMPPTQTEPSELEVADNESLDDCKSRRRVSLGVDSVQGPEDCETMSGQDMIPVLPASTSSDEEITSQSFSGQMNWPTAVRDDSISKASGGSDLPKKVEQVMHARIRCSVPEAVSTYSSEGSFGEEEGRQSVEFHSAHSGYSEADGPALKLQVHETWTRDAGGDVNKDVMQAKWSVGFRFQAKSGISLDEREMQPRNHLMDRFVLAQNNVCLLSWSLLGFVFIMFDLIVIPFQVFDPPGTIPLRVVEMSITVFWSCDMFMNFFRGFTKVNGVNEIRFRETAWNYIRSWLLPDMFLVIVDWLVLLSEVLTDNMGLFRVGKLARLSKTIRVIRLFRLAKTNGGFWGQLTKKFNSEELATLIKLAGRFLFVIICAHWVACAWYGITIIQGDDVETWMNYHMPSDRGLTYRYFTAMHWSLTQFTPASMEVYPHNATERILNVIVLLLGLLTFTSLISSISNTMSHLQNLNHTSFLRQQHLRKWLGENRVSMNLVTSVLTCVKNSKQHTQRTPQKDVELLKVLPKHILAKLCEEVLQPVFETHPYFSSYLHYNPTSMRRLCSAAIQEAYLYERDELFNCGDTAERAFFIRNGRLVYESMPEQHAGIARNSDARNYAQLMRTTTRGPGKLTSDMMDLKFEKTSTVVSPGDRGSANWATYSSQISGMHPGADRHVIEEGAWLSEIALWAEWTHCGPLIATYNSELVSIESKLFCQTMGKYVIQDHMLRRYARLYADRAVHELRLLDIWFDPVVLEDLAWCAFFEESDFTEGLPKSIFPSSHDEHLLRIPAAAPFRENVEVRLKRWHERVQELREEYEDDDGNEGFNWRLLFGNGEGLKRKSGRESRHSCVSRRSERNTVSRPSVSLKKPSILPGNRMTAQGSNKVLPGLPIRRSS